MEIEELKNVWAQYDKKLSENLKFNEVLFRKMNLEKSKREMNTPLNYEIGSVIIGVFFTLYIVSSTIRFSGEIKFLISGILASAICFIMFGLSIHRLNLLSRIDYYNSSVVELQKTLSKFQQKYLQYKKIEILIVPFFVITVAPILGIAMRNFDILAYPTRFIIVIIVSLVISYPGMIWIYKNWYEKRIKNTTDFLEEINNFEKK